MKLTRFYFQTFILLLVAIPFSAKAAYTLKNGKLINTNEVATMSVQEHYSAAMDAHEKKNWEEVVHQCIIVIRNFPETPFAEEAQFYLGIGYFYLEDFEMSNKHLSKYLKKQTTPKHFEEAITHKFTIAEKFQKGAKKHVMGWKSLPQWMPAKEEAIEIYDEVITALPHHDLAAAALFGKAKLLLKDDDFKQSVEAYQTLIRRFPKHPLAIESYIGIAEVYEVQCKAEYPDPDLIDLSEINLKKFRQNFPSEDRIALAEDRLKNMQEFYAENLFQTGDFFERTKKPNAALIYYNKVIAKYPDTKTASVAEKRLKKLKVKPEKVEQK